MLKYLMAFAWHDIQLVDMALDRSKPGDADTVRFIVE